MGPFIPQTETGRQLAIDSGIWVPKERQVPQRALCLGAAGTTAAAVVSVVVASILLHFISFHSIVNRIQLPGTGSAAAAAVE